MARDGGTGKVRKRRILFAFSSALFVLNLLVWLFLLHDDEALSITFLDVGQGDSILIESPSGADVLIDAGRDRSALRELGKTMGPLDRTIDAVIATHPDADHIGGMPAVLERYRVRSFVTSGVESDTNPSLALEGAVLEEESVKRVVARRGDRIHFGDGAYADVLFPDREVPTVEANTGSIVLRLVYGDTSFLLTGDAPDEIENWLVFLEDNLKSDVLKAGHHGSRTSTSQAFLDAVDPEIVVVSAGKGNSYGHPHQEVVERIVASGARLLSTAQEGTIRLESDGTTVRLR